MRETDLVRRCMMAASKCGAVVWRNNTGAYKDKAGRLVRYGLCVGSSDIIGIYEGRFIAIECKVGNAKLTKEQEIFIEAVKNQGGVAFVARSEDDVKKVLT